MRLQYSGSSDGTLLATFEQYSSGTPVFPIYRSTDKGNSWTQISSVTDTHNGFGMRYQPFLYELPTAVGDFPAGTLLAAGNSIPSDLSSTELDLYASTDHGASWSYVSTVATGGKADPTNGQTPVWEPFLMVSGSKLIVYYSDQRDPNNGQKIVRQVSTDGLTWGSVVNDVATSTYNDRPGMPVVAKLPNGNYVTTYEFWGAPEGGFAVYYKTSSDPEAFGSATGIALKATDGTQPKSSPLPGGEGKPMRLSMRAEHDISVHLATLSPKMLRLTGEIADGWLGTSFVPEGAKEAYFDHLGRGLADAGRTRADLDICQGAEVAFADDENALRAMVAGRRKELAFSLGGMGSATTNFYNNAYSRQGWAEVAAEVRTRWQAGDRDGAAGLVTDEMVLATTLIGTEDMVRERLRVWRDVGVDTVRFYPAGESLDARLATLGRAIDLVRDIEGEAAR
ncbi:LLM class flavin-dependent oxidoreductase [Streptomyces sp. NPDC012616]|uniref:LLM class flavin-dependent oxidoreductase n=1 Tax=Streptomyces sp. NPDC012616 TaxID=3364840 RepID=UPI0036E86213